MAGDKDKIYVITKGSIDFESYPKTWKGCCFWDTEPFEDPPVLIPLGFTYSHTTVESKALALFGKSIKSNIKEIVKLKWDQLSISARDGWIAKAKSELGSGPKLKQVPIKMQSVKCRAFCSFSCAKRYILSEVAPKIKMRLLANLEYLQFRLTGEVTKITPAPPREALGKFHNGDSGLSITEFRDFGMRHKLLEHLPTIYFQPEVMEVVDKTNIEEKKRKNRDRYLELQAEALKRRKVDTTQTTQDSRSIGFIMKNDITKLDK
jgi:hypothetical protein